MGGARDSKTGAWLKKEGVKKGVPDLVLNVKRSHYGALYIEMKSDGGRQSKDQKEKQKALEYYGYKYVICRTLEGFMSEVNEYLSDKSVHIPNSYLLL